MGKRFGFKILSNNRQNKVLTEQAEKDIARVLGAYTRYDDNSMDFKDFSFARLKLLILYLTGRGTDHVNYFTDNVIRELMILPLWDSDKLKNAAYKGNVQVIFDYVYNTFRKYADEIELQDSSTADVLSVIYILLKYSNEFREKAKSFEKIKPFIDLIVNYAMTIQLEKYFTYFIEKLELVPIQQTDDTSVDYKVEKSELGTYGVTISIPKLKDFSFQYLNNGVEKKEFCNIVNQFVTKYLNGEVNHTIPYFWNMLDTSDIKNDWSFLRTFLWISNKDLCNDDFTKNIRLTLGDAQSKFSDIIVPNDLNLGAEYYGSIAIINNYVLAKLESMWTFQLLNISCSVACNFLTCSVKNNDIMLRSREEEINSLRVENKKLNKTIEKNNEVIKGLEEQLEKERIRLTPPKEIIVDKKTFSNLQSQISEKEITLSNLQNSHQKAIVKADWQSKRIKSLEEELEKTKAEKEFSITVAKENDFLKQQIDYLNRVLDEETEEEFQRKYEVVKDIPILFFGGVGGMLSKLLTIFQNSSYIDISEDTSNANVEGNYRYAVCFSRVNTHSLLQRVEKKIGRQNIIFTSFCNPRLVVEEIFEAINS